MATPFLICAHADPTRCYELTDYAYFRDHYEPQGYYVARGGEAHRAVPSLGGEPAAPEAEAETEAEAEAEAPKTKKAKA